MSVLTTGSDRCIGRHRKASECNSEHQVARNRAQRLVPELTEEELAFYNALETNDSAVKVLGKGRCRMVNWAVLGGSVRGRESASVHPHHLKRSPASRVGVPAPVLPVGVSDLRQHRVPERLRAS